MANNNNHNHNHNQHPLLKEEEKKNKSCGSASPTASLSNNKAKLHSFLDYAWHATVLLSKTRKTRIKLMNDLLLICDCIRDAILIDYLSFDDEKEQHLLLQFVQHASRALKHLPAKNNFDLCVLRIILPPLRASCSNNHNDDDHESSSFDKRSLIFLINRGALLARMQRELSVLMEAAEAVAATTTSSASSSQQKQHRCPILLIDIDKRLPSPQQIPLVANNPTASSVISFLGDFTERLKQSSSASPSPSSSSSSSNTRTTTSNTVAVIDYSGSANNPIDSTLLNGWMLGYPAVYVHGSLFSSTSSSATTNTSSSSTTEAAAVPATVPERGSNNTRKRQKNNRNKNKASSFSLSATTMDDISNSNNDDVGDDTSIDNCLSMVPLRLYQVTLRHKKQQQQQQQQQGAYYKDLFDEDNCLAFSFSIPLAVAAAAAARTTATATTTDDDGDHSGGLNTFVRDYITRHLFSTLVEGQHHYPQFWDIPSTCSSNGDQTSLHSLVIESTVWLPNVMS